MYFELQGTFYIDGKILRFLHEDRKTAYQLEGEDAALLKTMIPYCTGTFHLNELAEKLSKSQSELDEIMEQLFKMRILRKWESLDKQALVVSHQLPEDSIHSLCRVPYLQNVCRSGSLSDARVTDSLLIAIADDADRDFFEEVSQVALSLQIPWLKVSLKDPSIYLGPLFFPDGGPCYGCFQRRVEINRVEDRPDVVESYGDLSSLLPGYVSREILKFFKNKTPSQVFGREIVLNTLTHECSSYQVLSLPTCKACHPRELFV